MSNILEQLQHIFPVAAFGRCSESQYKFGMEIGKNLSVRVGSRMVALIYNQIIKILLAELGEVLGNTLHCGENNILRCFLLQSAVLAERCLRPYLRESFFGLCYQL